jgi:hypothetical protein
MPHDYIPIPRAVLSLSPAVWVTPSVWQHGNAVEISHDIFSRLGNRAPVVATLTDDDGLPTRGVFITSHYPLDYNELQWPCGVPPLVFYSVESKQQVRHYHAAAVFNYYSKSPGHWAQAMGLHNVSCTRIKLSWRKTERYMQLQAQRLVSYVVNREEALDFEDYHRQMDRDRFVRLEHATLGFPGMFNYHTSRSLMWQFMGIQPRAVTVDEIDHVVHTEIHVSLIEGAADISYRGEFVVCIKPTDRGVVDAPTIAGCVLGLRELPAI